MNQDYLKNAKWKQINHNITTQEVTVQTQQSKMKKED
jgi:hypothetical protein